MPIAPAIAPWPVGRSMRATSWSPWTMKSTVKTRCWALPANAPSQNVFVLEPRSAAHWPVGRTVTAKPCPWRAACGCCLGAAGSPERTWSTVAMVAPRASWRRRGGRPALRDAPGRDGACRPVPRPRRGSILRVSESTDVAPEHRTSRRDAPAHGHGPAAPATRRVRLVLAALLVPALLATLAGLAALWPAASDVPDRVPVAAEGSTILRATVVGPVDEAASLVPARLDAGSRAAGDDVGGEEITVNAPPEYVAYGFDEGDRLRVLYIAEAAGAGGSPYVFLDFERGLPIGLLAAAYAVVVLAVARWRGLAALAGLAGAFVVITAFTLPALLTGQNALGVALVTSSLVMFVVLYVAHGFTARTSTALLGTLVGLAITALLG